MLTFVGTGKVGHVSGNKDLRTQSNVLLELRSTSLCPGRHLMKAARRAHSAPPQARYEEETLDADVDEPGPVHPQYKDQRNGPSTTSGAYFIQDSRSV